jgi:predicted DNA-binding transcriptional regulator AlpA
MNTPKKNQMPENNILTMKEFASYLKIAEKTAYKYALERQ